MAEKPEHVRAFERGYQRAKDGAYPAPSGSWDAWADRVFSRYAARSREFADLSLGLPPKDPRTVRP